MAVNSPRGSAGGAPSSPVPRRPRPRAPGGAPGGEGAGPGRAASPAGGRRGTRFGRRKGGPFRRRRRRGGASFSGDGLFRLQSRDGAPFGGEHPPVDDANRLFLFFSDIVPLEDTRNLNSNSPGSRRRGFQNGAARNYSPGSLTETRLPEPPGGVALPVFAHSARRPLHQIPASSGRMTRQSSRDESSVKSLECQRLETRGTRNWGVDRHVRRGLEGRRGSRFSLTGGRLSSRDDVVA